MRVVGISRGWLPTNRGADEAACGVSRGRPSAQSNAVSPNCSTKAAATNTRKDGQKKSARESIFGDFRSQAATRWDGNLGQDGDGEMVGKMKEGFWAGPRVKAERLVETGVFWARFLAISILQ
jgi:hypothetical protein